MAPEKKTGVLDTIDTAADLAANASIYAAAAKMFDSIAGGVNKKIQSNLKGYNQNPDYINQGLFGDSSGWNMRRMWTMESALKDSVNQVKDYGNKGFNASSYNNLMSDFNSTDFLKTSKISDRDLKKADKADFLFDPASYLATSLFGKRRSAKQRQNTINSAIESANKKKMTSFNTNVANIDNKNKMQAMQNMFALGGLLNDFYMRGAVDYDLMTKNIENKRLNTFSKDKFNINPVWANALAQGGNLNTSGTIFDKNYTNIEGGGTHEQNIFGGVPMGVDEEGNPNLVEEGEVVWEDYVFSNRLTNPKTGRTFAEDAKRAQKEIEERPNDPISKRGLNAEMTNLQILQEEVRQTKLPTGQANVFAGGGSKPKNYYDTTLPWGLQMLLGDTTPTDGGELPEVTVEAKRGGSKPKNQSKSYNKSSFKPIPEALGVGLPDVKAKTGEIKTNDKLNNITKKFLADNNKDTDWSKYNPKERWEIMRAMAVVPGIIGMLNPPKAHSIKTPNVSRATYNPLGEYLKYTPFDTDYRVAQLNAESSAVRRALADSSNPSRNAALLAAGLNAQTSLGDLVRNAEDYNLSQRNAVAQFNRGTNQANQAAALQAALANQNRDLGVAQMDIAAQQYVNDQLDKLYGVNVGNINNLFANLSKMGEDKLNRYDARWAAKYLPGGSTIKFDE